MATFYAEIIFLDLLGLLVMLFRNLQMELEKHCEPDFGYDFWFAAQRYSGTYSIFPTY